MTSDGSLRLSGLFSGLDTDTIIQKLLSVEQLKLDSLNEEKELTQAKIETWEDISEQLKSFAEIVKTLRADGTSGNTLFDDKVTTSSDSTVAWASATASAVKNNYSVNITQIAQGEVNHSTVASGYTVTGASTIDINGTSISLDDGDTISDIADAINLASFSLGNRVVASVIDDKLVLQHEDTGAAASITPSDTVGTVIADLTLATSQTAQDASVSINGVPITSSSNNLTDVTTGLTINLISDGTTTVNVLHDTDTIKSTITDFIDSYNETRDLIERVRNVKLDENEQFGLFFSDSLLRTIFNDLRNFSTNGVTMGSSVWDSATTSGAGTANDIQINVQGLNVGGNIQTGDQFLISGDNTIYTVLDDVSVDGNPKTISISPPLTADFVDSTAITVVSRSMESIGLGVRTDTVSGVAGILGILDEGELDSVLSSDVDLVERIFTRTNVDDSDDATKTGVARRLFDFIDSQTKVSFYINKIRSIDDIKIPGFESEIELLDDQITKQEDRLSDRETALVRQFASLESAMSQAQQAGNTLSALG